MAGSMGNRVAESSLAVRGRLELFRGQAVHNRARGLFQRLVVGREHDEDVPAIMVRRGPRQQVRRIDVDFEAHVPGVDGIGRNTRPEPDAGGVEWAAGGGFRETGRRHRRGHRVEPSVVCKCTSLFPQLRGVCDISRRVSATPGNKPSRNSRGNPRLPVGSPCRHGRPKTRARR